MNPERDYFLLAVGGLGVLGVGLYLGGYDQWWLGPVNGTVALLVIIGIGLLALWLRWWIGPAAVLTLVTALVVVASPFRGGFNVFEPMPTEFDLLMAVAAFVYVGAAMRYHSLARLALPFDRRRESRPFSARVRGRSALPTGPTKRTPERVGVGEFVWLLLLAVLFSVAGYLIAFRIQVEVAPEGSMLPDDRFWRALVCVWLLVLALLGGRALTKCLGWMNWGREEAQMYLQDQLWSETRGEQRRIQRWVMWQKQREGE